MLHRRLCANCNNDRLVAASAARIRSSSGLTWSNVEEFSEENWINKQGAGEPRRD